MDPKTNFTQENLLSEMDELTTSFGLDMKNFSENLDSMVESSESYPTNKPEIYQCPWDNQGDIILFV